MCVIMLNAIMLIVVMLSVVAPEEEFLKLNLKCLEMNKDLHSTHFSKYH
jgi:hypothetical protein